MAIIDFNAHHGSAPAAEASSDDIPSLSSADADWIGGHDSTFQALDEHSDGGSGAFQSIVSSPYFPVSCLALVSIFGVAVFFIIRGIRRRKAEQTRQSMEEQKHHDETIVKLVRQSLLLDELDLSKLVPERSESPKSIVSEPLPACESPVAPPRTKSLYISRRMTETFNQVHPVSSLSTTESSPKEIDQPRPIRRAPAPVLRPVSPTARTQIPSRPSSPSASSSRTATSQPTSPPSAPPSPPRSPPLPTSSRSAMPGAQRAVQMTRPTLEKPQFAQARPISIHQPVRVVIDFPVPTDSVTKRESIYQVTSDPSETDKTVATQYFQKLDAVLKRMNSTKQTHQMQQRGA